MIKDYYTVKLIVKIEIIGEPVQSMINEDYINEKMMFEESIYLIKASSHEKACEKATKQCKENLKNLNYCNIYGQFVKYSFYDIIESYCLMKEKVKSGMEIFSSYARTYNKDLDKILDKKYQNNEWGSILNNLEFNTLSLRDLVEKAKKTKYNYLHLNSAKILRVYEEDNDIFILHYINKEYDLCWAVNDLSNLIKKVNSLLDETFTPLTITYAGEESEMVLSYFEENGISFYKNYIEYELIFGSNEHELDSKISVMAKADIGEVMKLEKELFSDYLQSKDDYVNVIHNNDLEVLVIKDNNNIFGFAAIEGLTDDKLYIRNIGISANYQHRGFGKKLLNSVLCYALKKGIRKCYLYVDENNINAISFYEKNGFINKTRKSELVFKVKRKF